MMKAGSIMSALVAVCCGFGATIASAESGVSVDGAYVRMPIPGKDMSAAFMQIHNAGSESQTLVSASADWAGSIELHTHTNDNGVMRMRQVDSIAVPAGTTVTLQPGGLHLMLFGLKQPLPQMPHIELCFADQHCQTVMAELKDMREMPAAGQGMNHGAGMHQH